MATSLLDEFALSHTPADVLRELVQNEYDAGGTELVIDLVLYKATIGSNAILAYLERRGEAWTVVVAPATDEHRATRGHTWSSVKVRPAVARPALCPEA